MTLDPNLLLVGPRGRRLCLESVRGRRGATAETGQLDEAISSAAYGLQPGASTLFAREGGVQNSPLQRSAEDVALLLRDAPLTAPDRASLLSALVATVDRARYWQEPDGADVLAAHPELRERLARVAAVLADSPRSAWWGTPLARDAQWAVRFDGIPVSDEASGCAADTIERWRAAAEDEEQSAWRDRPIDPQASWSGAWWSTPPKALTRTTRVQESGGPAGLWLVEDRLNWDQASVHLIHVPSDARVYEIDGHEAWAELSRRFPLDVTASRRHDWYRATGRNGRWVIPDWARVAREYDAVHLTVAGYLSTAGAAVTVEGDAMTVLAGWDPDETFWLCDIERDAAVDQVWRYDDYEGWMLSTAL